MTFDQFRQRLADALDFPVDEVRRETRFREDLALDSIGMLELMVVLDELEIDIPLDVGWDVDTVGGAYELLVERDAAGAAGPAPAGGAPDA